MPALKRGWKRVRESLANAFRVEPEEVLELTDRQKQIVDRFAEWVVRRRLTMPALMTLESVTPLNFIGNQLMVFMSPFVTAFMKPDDYKEFQNLLEHRESIPVIIKAIDAAEEAWVNRHTSHSAEPSSSDDKE